MHKGIILIANLLAKEKNILAWEPTSDLHIRVRSHETKSEIKLVWVHFGAWCVLYHCSHELYFTLGLSLLWVLFHFSQINRSEISNQCEIACEHIFPWSEFSTLNEMKLWRNLIGQFKLTSVHTPKMKCPCEQTKTFKTSLQLKNDLSFKPVWNFHVNILL